MDDDKIGSINIEIAPDALREIIAAGRLSEFADKLAVLAATEVHAQLVEAVSKAALEPKSIASGFSGGFAAILEGGDFGTVPFPKGPRGPRPFAELTFSNRSLTRTISNEVGGFRG